MKVQSSPLVERDPIEYLIRVGQSENIKIETLNNDLSKALDAKFGEGSMVESLEMVGPKVGKEPPGEGPCCHFLFHALNCRVYLRQV